MEALFPTDAQVFVAVVALLRRDGLRSQDCIISCRKQMHASRPVYWVTCEQGHQYHVAQALSNFLERPMAATYGQWPLSLADVRRVLEWHSRRTAGRFARDAGWLV
jgi:hypothetical protein